MRGLHRNVIHPDLGSFILLDTVLINADVDKYGAPLDYNPYLECKLCSAACPTGFDNPINCLTHTYRELVGEKQFIS